MKNAIAEVERMLARPIGSLKDPSYGDSNG